ncbi:hypothetical protein BN2364_3967 [Alloalcanivorax xenomutans]|nr:hypothetical protein BN2364_3967 [Alloalcanivorax xenomutans]
MMPLFHCTRSSFSLAEKMSWTLLKPGIYSRYALQGKGSLGMQL